MRRAAAAARSGIPALQAPQLRFLFITHLHSDHTMGINDVIFTPWIQGRQAPLQLYGPPGLQHMADGIIDAYAEDIAERSRRRVGLPEPCGRRCTKSPKGRCTRMRA